MAVAMLLLMLGLVTMLGLLGVGYVYWARRDAQKVADLASLAGAQMPTACAANNQDNTAARGNAQIENGFSQQLAISCGTWDPVANAGTPDHFAAPPGAQAPNAVKVVATRATAGQGPGSLLPSVSATAVSAAQPPIAVFSVSGALAQVNGSGLLSQALTGIGLPLTGTSLVSYDGLANVTITPAGLLQQLGVSVPADITVGGLNALLASQLQAHALIDVLDATVKAAGRQDLLGADVSLVNAINASLGTNAGNVALGSTNGAGGLFAQIVAPDSAAQSALNAQVNALQLIITAIGVATGDHAVGVDVATPSGGIFGALNVTAKTRVIEPPAIGIGGIGTTAYSAQLRTFLELKFDSGGIPVVGSLLNPLARISLDVPLAIDLVNAQATLTDLCDGLDSQGRPQAVLAVDSSVLQMCVGNFTAANAFSTSGSCSSIPGASSPASLLAVSAAGKPLLTLNSALTLSPLTSSGTGALYPGQSKNIPDGGTSLAVGTAVNNLMTALTIALTTQGTPGNSSQTSGALAQDLWNATAGSSPLNLTRLSQALTQLQSASQGLQGLLGNDVGSVATILGSALSLNVPSLLGGVAGLLGNTGSALGQVASTLGCTVSDTACVSAIQGAMAGNSGTVSNAYVALLGFVAQTLQGPLNAVGTQMLTPLLRDTLGLSLGVSTVTLHGLQCHRAQLVY